MPIRREPINIVTFPPGPVLENDPALPALNVPVNYLTDAAKLAGSGLGAGQVVKITGEANRIERFLGGDQSVQANWLVLKNTVVLSVRATALANPCTFNGVSLVAGVETNVGWVDPLAFDVVSSGAAGTFSIGFWYLETAAPTTGIGSSVSTYSIGPLVATPRKCALPFSCAPRGFAALVGTL